MDDALQQRLANRAKLPVTKTPTPAPVDPALAGDPVAQAIAERLLRQFSGKSEPGESPAAEPVSSAPLDEQRFTDLRNLRNAEDKLAQATARNDKLQGAIKTLAEFVQKREQRVKTAVGRVMEGYVPTYYRDVASTHFALIKSESTALLVFSYHPDLPTEVFESLGAEPDTIASWQRWHQGFVEAESHEVWLERLQDVRDGKNKFPAGQQEFCEACLRAADVDIQAKLSEIRERRVTENLRNAPPIQVDILGRRRQELDRQEFDSERARRQRQAVLNNQGYSCDPTADTRCFRYGDSEL